jgi:hypothetical protein
MPGLKTLVPIRRRNEVSHDELVTFWRDVHMPGVVAHMRPDHYSVTLFDEAGDRVAPEERYDGMATLWFDDAARGRQMQGRTMPAEVAGDGFGDRIVFPMARLDSTEHVIVDGPREAAGFKFVALVRARPGVGPNELRRHWLDVHAPNVASDMVAAGGLRYVVSIADQGSRPAEYAGVAELWYRDKAAWKAHAVSDDGFNAMTRVVFLRSAQELIGIP